MTLASPDPLYELLEQRLAEWALAQPDVLAVVIIGSRARRDHPADAWSDLDCIVFVDSVQAYLRPEPWKTDLELRLQEQSRLQGQPRMPQQTRSQQPARQLAPWFAAFNLHNNGDPEWELMFSEGIKLDLLFSRNRSTRGSQASLADLLPNFPYQNVLERGMRVLVEKNPSAGPPHLPVTADASRSQQNRLPTQSEFENCVANYLLDLSRAAKLSRRGEVWRAARAINEELQNTILTLLEWQARTLHGPHTDTWRYGRFLEEWIDPQSAARLPALYTDNTLPGIRRSIRAALDFLGWLGPALAEHAGLRFPAETVQVTGAWLRDTLSLQEE